VQFSPAHRSIASIAADFLLAHLGRGRRRRTPLALESVAYAYLAGRSWSRPLAVAFNLLGIADLVVAVGTGFLASPSPFRLFFSQPSTSLMTVLPMVLIPTFLVPFWILVHAASLRVLLVAGRVPEHSAAGSGGVEPASTGQFSIGPTGPAWRSGR